MNTGEPYDLVSDDEAPMLVGSPKGAYRNPANTWSLSKTGDPNTNYLDYGPYSLRVQTTAGPRFGP